MADLQGSGVLDLISPAASSGPITSGTTSLPESYAAMGSLAASPAADMGAAIITDYSPSPLSAFASPSSSSFVIQDVAPVYEPGTSTPSSVFTPEAPKADFNYWVGNAIDLSNLGTPSTLAGGKVGWSLSPDIVSKTWGDTLSLGATRFTGAVSDQGVLNLSGAKAGELSPVPLYDSTGRMTGFTAKPSTGGSVTVTRNSDGSAQVVLDSSLSGTAGSFAAKVPTSAVFQIPNSGAGYPREFKDAGTIMESAAGPKLFQIPGAAGKFGDDTKAVMAVYDDKTGQWNVSKAVPGSAGSLPWNDSMGAFVMKDDSASGWGKTDWLAIAPTIVSVLTLAGSYFMAERQMQQQLKLSRESTEAQLQMLGMQYAARSSGSGDGSGSGLKVKALLS